VNLRNAEATFGKGSSQCLDIMEIIENYMASRVESPKVQSESDQKQERKPEPASFLNLAFRPKP
jgi:hypothetical protein